MNKKQLIVMSILLSLMLMLAITQYFFKENFEQIVLIDKVISELEEYGFDEDNYVVLLPSEWTVDKNESKGKYVSCRLIFKNKNNELTGLLEVINTKGNLAVFAENDLNNQYLEYCNSEIIPFKNSNNSGVLIKYETSVINGYNFKNKCYYLNLEEGKIIKILFNLKEKGYSGNMEVISSDIVESIKSS